VLGKLPLIIVHCGVLDVNYGTIFACIPAPKAPPACSKPSTLCPKPCAASPALLLLLPLSLLLCLRKEASEGILLRLLLCLLLPGLSSSLHKH